VTVPSGSLHVAQIPPWRVRGDPLVAGGSTGPLRGLTVAVKDTFAVAGYAVGAGNPTWLAGAPAETRHATAVQLLLDAGADVTGLAHTAELAYNLTGVNDHYGAPRNPAAPGRVPGGSSSGSASAVASGEADIGLGSDTAGSIRVPASYCGLFSLRVTHGSVPVAGLVPLAPSFDAVGWLARDAGTLDRIALVLLPHAEPAAVRRVVVATGMSALATQEVQSALAEPTDRVAAALGATHDATPVPGAEQLDAWLDAFATVQQAEAWESHGDWIRSHPDALGRDVGHRFALGSRVGRERREQAEGVLRHAREVLDDVVPPGTVLVQPAAATPATPLDVPEEDAPDVRARTLRLTCAASLAGLPVVTVPAGTVEGCPVGLSLVGPRGSDRMLTAAARALGH